MTVTHIVLRVVSDKVFTRVPPRLDNLMARLDWEPTRHAGEFCADMYTLRMSLSALRKARVIAHVQP